jgi:hypothetical protein
MMRWLVAVLTLATLAVLLWFLLPKGRPAPQVTAPSDALAQEVQALKAEVGGLRAHAQPKIYLVPSPPTAEVTSAPVANASADRLPERTPEQKQMEAAQTLEAKFESEPIDAAWSVTMVREIRAALSSAAPAARVLQANCATSFCRVVLGHDAEDDQREFASQVAATKPFQEGVFYDYDQTPKALKTTLYVVRRGYSFRE